MVAECAELQVLINAAVRMVVAELVLCLVFSCNLHIQRHW